MDVVCSVVGLLVDLVVAELRTEVVLTTIGALGKGSLQHRELYLAVEAKTHLGLSATPFPLATANSPKPQPVLVLVQTPLRSIPHLVPAAMPPMISASVQSLALPLAQKATASS